MTIFLIFMAVALMLLILQVVFDPKFDKLDDGTHVLWYDGGVHRNYIKLW